MTTLTAPVNTPTTPREILRASTAQRGMWLYGGAAPVLRTSGDVQSVLEQEVSPTGPLVLPTPGDTIDVPGALSLCGTVLNITGEMMQDCPNPVRCVRLEIVDDRGIITTHTGIPASSVDARTCLRSVTTEGARAIAVAYRSLASRAADAERDRERYMDGLVARAHRYADDNDLCSAFDDFMISENLEPRKVDAYADLTVTVTLTLRHEARIPRCEGDIWENFDEETVREDVQDHLANLTEAGGLTVTGYSIDDTDYGEQFID